MTSNLSLVIPVYKNLETIPLLLESLGRLDAELQGALQPVFVVDGSPDRSYELLQEKLPDCSFRSELLVLSRNFGSFSAVRAGLSIANGPLYAVMAADLQEPPELIARFYRVMVGGTADIVLGRRTRRADPVATRWASGLFWQLYRWMVQPEIPPGGVDVFACNRAVRDALLDMNEANTSLVGQLIWLGFRREVLPYERRRRAAGHSAWTLRKRLRYMQDSIYSFTDLPIRLLSLVGILGVGLSIVVSAVVLVFWLLGKIPVLGYTPLMLVILFSTFLILFGLGIIGNYVWRTFENSKGRPLVVPSARESFHPRQE